MSGNLSVGHRFDFNTPGLTTSNIKLGAGDDNTVADDQDINNPFAYGFSVLDNLQLVLQKIANALFGKINTSTDRARNTQDMSNRMDEVIADAAKGDDKTRKPVPDEVVKYMRDNGILVDGMSIDDYISKHGGTDGLDKGSLQAVKAALDNSANRDTDLMTQGQLSIQKMTQEINAVVTQMTGLLSKWGDLLSMIAQKMY
ncbi:MULTISPECIES: secretion protein [Enterobacteriaceae]|jgi:secreted effector protein SseB|uniref:Secretion protein n=2 Tax=Enterobacteriaceae TaxID=543 RepID=A0A089Q5P1_9ENTR|nr:MULTISPECIES: secretion protein [Enterobacteriaceae]AIR06611.1 secretion protein [Cedecea neteri]EHM45834.1 EspA-like secreted protein [Yokenella regensburgei ATCC 43003]KFD21360.1 SseB family secretion system effector [Yokenella regensburgei ATCC 49455]MDQ4428249.1 secretion protein [Yokenella regensburgei]NWC64777.1 secretion protein [Cedecea sp. P7760]